MEQIRVCTYDGPGAQPVIRNVPWPTIPKRAALIKVGACGVCGTDLHILKGHWPKPLPWPFTLGHEIGGVLVEVGAEFKQDFMSKPLEVGSKVMIPPLMPCGQCYYCIHYPESANKCLTPVYYGRYLGFDKAPHLWGGWAEYVYVDLDMLPGTKIYKLPDDMSLRLGALSEPLTSCIRAFNRATRAGGFSWGDTVVIQGSGPIGILAVAAARLLHRALDRILRHVLLPGGDDGRAQPGIHGGIGQAHLGRNRDFARQLAEQFRLLGILPALAVHDVLELGMAGHGCLLTESLGNRGREARRYRLRARQNQRHGADFGMAVVPSAAISGNR